jgi:hypothetical protein
MVLVVPFALEMAQERKQRPDGPTQNIDEEARLAIIAAMGEQDPPMTKAALARACRVTGGAITLLLSKPIPKGQTRGCKFLPELQKALSMTSSASAVVVTDNKAAMRRIWRIVRDLDDATLEHWIQTGEMLAGKS